MWKLFTVMCVTCLKYMWNWFRSTYYCLLLLTKSNVFSKLLIMGILLGDTTPCSELYKLKCQQLSFASSSNAMALFSTKNYFVIHSNRWIWLNFIPKMCVLTYCCSYRLKQKKMESIHLKLLLVVAVDLRCSFQIDK